VTESAPLAFRRLHPVSLLYAWGRGIRQIGALLILPALATDAGREASGGVSRVALAALVTALVTAVGAIADYVTRQFALGPETLVIRSGVLRRATRSIPYARIQGASTLQSLSQRWLGVGILRIDTGAGGRVAEAELSVLRWRDVEALRDDIMRRRRPATESAHASTPGDAGQDIPRPDAAPTSPPANAAETLASVPDAQLLLAGATSLQLLAVLASLVGLVDRLGARERVATIVPLIADLATLVSTNRGFGSLLAILVVGAILAGLALVWLGGVVLTWARYRGFRLMRSGTALVREYGWLERRTATTPFMRIQGVVVRESPLRRLAGRAEVGLVSAGTMGVSESGQAPDVPMLLPIVRDSEVGGAVSLVYPDARINGASTSPVPDWRRVSRRTWLRTGLVWTLRLTLILPVAALLLGTGVQSHRTGRIQ
jgi:putative membrane protein